MRSRRIPTPYVELDFWVAQRFTAAVNSPLVSTEFTSYRIHKLRQNSRFVATLRIRVCLQGFLAELHGRAMYAALLARFGVSQEVALSCNIHNLYTKN